MARRFGCILPWDFWSTEDLPVCSKIKALKHFHLAYFRLTWKDLKGILEYTGCGKPCKYNEYKIVGEDKAQSKPGRAGIYFQFATKDVVIEKELASYSGLSLLSDIGGSLGLFLGFSFLMVWDAVGNAFHKLRQFYVSRQTD